MDVAERMCDTIFMIFRGKKVLDGSLESIQDQYGSDTIRVRMHAVNGALGRLEGVSRVNNYGAVQRDCAWHPAAIRSGSCRQLVELGTIEHFELARPSLHDIFVRIAGPESQEVEETTHA